MKYRASNPSTPVPANSPFPFELSNDLSKGLRIHRFGNISIDSLRGVQEHVIQSVDSELQYVPEHVQVFLPNDPTVRGVIRKGVPYSVTDRTIGELEECFFRKGEISPRELVGKTVLDAGCGSGGFPSALRELHEIDAWGIDLSITEGTTQKRPYLRWADMTELSTLRSLNLSFDVVVSTVSLWHYVGIDRQGDPGDIAASLKEFDSILKPGGRIYCGLSVRRFPDLLVHPSERIIEEAVATEPNLEIVDRYFVSGGQITIAVAKRG